MKAPKTIFSAAVALAMSAGAVIAKTEVHWWHAMGGTNGERVDKIAADFNASQNDYEIIPSYKGNYTGNNDCSDCSISCKRTSTFSTSF